jgi:hypothetical protein
VLLGWPLRTLLGLAVLAAGVGVAGPGRAVGPNSRAATATVSSPVQAGSRPSRPRTHRRSVFAHRILVAYYGTAGSGALGILGASGPMVMTHRLRVAARPFGTAKRKVQIVYELVASVADSDPGADGNYSHYIARSQVREYIRAAHRHRALLVLDLQPGRESFVPQARHFRWALRRPFVGLGLDPEWRMGPGQVPAQTIGSVQAGEVNHVSRLVTRIVRRNSLPQKLFVIHEFRTSMVTHIARVHLHRQLAIVQHIDGFGSRGEKLATYHTVARPDRFTMGFKLFYRQDADLFTPREVERIRPKIDFVSYE